MEDKCSLPKDATYTKWGTKQPPRIDPEELQCCDYLGASFDVTCSQPTSPAKVLLAKEWLARKLPLKDPPPMELPPRGLPPMVFPPIELLPICLTPRPSLERSPLSRTQLVKVVPA